MEARVEAMSRDEKSRGPQRRSLLEDESGATMVLGVFMAAMAVGVLYYLHGVANVLIQREHMQDAADSAAFLAAVVRARAMNILAILNMIMAAFAVVGTAFRVAQDIIEGAAIAASLVCLGCGPWCGYCCEACVDAFEHWMEYDDSSNTADSVENMMENLIAVTHGVAVAIEYGAPILAEVRVTEYGRVEYAPSTNMGFAWPILGLQAEEDDTNWPCEEYVEVPGGVLGVVVSAIQAHWSLYYIGSAAITPWFSAPERARHYCGSFDSFQRVPPDSYLGEQPFQVQAYMIGEPHWRWSRQGVQVASWGRDASNMTDSLEAANDVSFAQAEYYFEDTGGKPHEEWLWHSQWRARERRFQLGDALPGGLGGAAGALNQLSSIVVH